MGYRFKPPVEFPFHAYISLKNIEAMCSKTLYFVSTGVERKVFKQKPYNFVAVISKQGHHTLKLLPTISQEKNLAR